MVAKVNQLLVRVLVYAFDFVAAFALGSGPREDVNSMSKISFELARTFQGERPSPNYQLSN